MITNKTFRILSIDGGGIKGLYAAKVLEKIEEHFSGKHIADHFDLICGTSTGGLIALALALKYKTADISKFYKEHAQDIFPRRNWVVRQLGQLFTNIYKADNLKDKLTLFFGENRTLGECQSLVCIPSFNISRGQPIVFKQSCDLNGYVRDQELNVIDVALATASAPTYFRNHYIDHPNLVSTYCTDGGMWANNPALCGILEAWDNYVGEGKPFDNVALLSISTAPKPTGKQHSGGGVRHWKGDLVGTSLVGQSFFTDHFLKKLSNSSIADVRYHRILPTNLSSYEQKLLEMDATTDDSLALLSSLGTQSGIDFLHQQNLWISPFFETQKHYIIK